VGVPTVVSALSIGRVAALVGVSIPTLRSWERRYALVDPARTPGGHRRYTDAEIDRLRSFAELARRNGAGEAAGLLERKGPRADQAP
jgi:MerR family transcriptional regulator, light-induced transcriptional regulator